MRLISKIILILSLNTFIIQTYAWEKEEHKILGNLVLDSTLSFCKINFTDSTINFHGRTGDIILNKKLWNRQSFGNISAFFSGDDLLQSHSQLKGNTILQQLSPLSAEYIDEVWNRIKEKPDGIHSVEVSDENVVYNYLLHHLIALRFANSSASYGEGSKENLRYALIYEAVAISFLSDAFSSGHLFLSVSDFLAPINRLNIQIAHDYYCVEGAYVVNSQGDCWQTFGDKLLQWYPVSFNNVYEAAIISLRELFLVYFTSLGNNKIPVNLAYWIDTIGNGKTNKELINSWLTSADGGNYYSERKIPALLRIPMVVFAA